MRDMRAITAVLQVINRSPATRQKIEAAIIDESEGRLVVGMRQVASCIDTLSARGFIRHVGRQPWCGVNGVARAVFDVTPHGRRSAHNCRTYAAGLLSLRVPAGALHRAPSFRGLPISLEGSIPQSIRRGARTTLCILEDLRQLSGGRVRMTRAKIDKCLVRLVLTGIVCNDGSDGNNSLRLTPVGRAKCEELQQIAAAIFHLDRIDQ